MDYNPLLPEVQQNPYPYYAHLRRHAPVFLVESMGSYAISRYDDVQFVLRNHQLFSSSVLFTALLGEFDPMPESPGITGTDPPVHTRLRKLANRAFTPRAVAALESRVRRIAQQLVANIRSKGQFDFVKDFAAPLPVMALSQMLGVELERQADFKRWTDDIIVTGGSRIIQEDDRKRILRSIADFREYFQHAIAVRRKERRDDLISSLVEAEEDNQTLTSDEVLSMAVSFNLAGNETTTNLMGNTMLALFDHPEQLARVQANPALIPNLLEEVLRYDAPVHLLFRRTTQAVDIAGTAIPEGAIVLPMFASANRDERKFVDPDRFDVNHNTEGHLGFGAGVHLCLGAPLARLEARVGLEELLPWFSDLSKPEGWAERLNSFVVRGPKKLSLSFKR